MAPSSTATRRHRRRCRRGQRRQRQIAQAGRLKRGVQDQPHRPDRHPHHDRGRDDAEQAVAQAGVKGPRPRQGPCASQAARPWSSRRWWCPSAAAEKADEGRKPGAMTAFTTIDKAQSGRGARVLAREVQRLRHLFAARRPAGRRHRSRSQRRQAHRRHEGAALEQDRDRRG